MGKWTEAQKAKARATRAKNKAAIAVKQRANLGTAAPDLRIRDAIALLKQAEDAFTKQKKISTGALLAILALRTLTGEI